MFGNGNSFQTYMYFICDLPSVNDIIMIVNTVDKHPIVSISKVWWRLLVLDLNTMEVNEAIAA